MTSLDILPARVIFNEYPDCLNGSNEYCANANSGSITYAAPPHAGHAPDTVGNVSAQSGCTAMRPAVIASARATDVAKTTIPLFEDTVSILAITQYNCAL